MTDQDKALLIEGIIKDFSLANLLGLISSICEEKAYHQDACGDYVYDEDWMRASDALLKLARECEL
jgi:hypothetical protein